MPEISRIVRDTSSVWEVVHPFTGRVEYATPDRLFAEALRDEFDKRDPLSVVWLFEEFYKLPAKARCNAEWVMSSATFAVIRKVKDPTGQYILHPSLVETPVLLGRLVAFDERAIGVSLRERVAP